MFRCLRIFLTVVFISWLIPMGIFIAPSKEKLLCGGQRAICLCSKGFASASETKGTIGQVLIKMSAPVKKEQTSSTVHYVSNIKLLFFETALSVSFFDQHKSFYNLAIKKSVDHVPKV